MAEIAIAPLTEAALCIEVSGEYDLADTPQGARTLRAALESDARAIVVDLSRCRFIDTAGLRCVAASHKRAARAGKAFAIVDGRLQVERFLRILELDDDVAVTASRESAVERLALSTG